MAETDNKRIAKNTLSLYLRMFFMLIVSFYTTREVLRILGVEDYGVYNIVGGVVTLFTFINGAMISTTQRFLNFEIGRGDVEGTKRVFNVSLLVHICIAFILLILAETVGLWIVNKYLNIPSTKVLAANIVYQFSIFGTMINILKAPYNAAIIAYERMSFFAYISVLEAISKLSIVYLLLLSSQHLLEIYAFLGFVVACVFAVIYYVYCNKEFPICAFKIERNGGIYKELLSFSGWNLFGSFANLGVAQGLSILINLFFGVVVNASIGIANQVNAAVYGFVSNFQVAFNPQIVKLYASNRLNEFTKLLIRTSKLSFCLMWALALPILLCGNEYLSFWLGTVPAYTTELCFLIMIMSLAEAIQGPLWSAVYATGKIRNYQICISILILLNLPVSYLFLKLGYSPGIIYVIRIILLIASLIYRLGYMKYNLNFSIREFCVQVCLPCLLVVCASLPIPLFVFSQTTGVTNTITTTLVSVMSTVISIYYIGLTRNERLFIYNAIKTKLNFISGH